MAGNVVARAWVQIIPEMSGSREKIGQELASSADAAGRQAGQRAGKSLSDTAAASASAGGAKAGSNFGASLSSRLSGIGGRLSSLFSGGLSNVKSLFSSSGTTSGTGFGSGVTSKLSGVGGRLSSLLSSGLSSVRALFSSSGALSGSGFGSGVLGKLAGIGGRIVSGIGSGLKSVVSLFRSHGQSSGEGMGAAMARGLSAKAAVLFAIAQNIANKVISTISASISLAVARVDTLNNFPKVLSNLGYSADESAAATDKLSDRLSSLPTRLDAAASGVQQLAPSSKSIDQATDRYLAFNDAILAGAASEDVQQNAMTQLTKAVSTGKMEMDTWMSIQQAMPGQLDQCAKHMLGQSASASDLYQAMKDGKVSVSEFADAMVDLDQNGGDGITSFADQATDAVGGIATSFSNMKNAVTKGVANVIQAIGAENITGVINGVKAGINGAFGGIVSMVEPAKQALSDLAGALGSMDAQTGVFTSLATAAQGLGAALGPAIVTLVQGGLAVLPGILGSVATVATPLISLVTAALPIVSQMAAQVMQFAADLLAAVAPALSSIVEVITASLPLIQAIWNAVWPPLSTVVTTVFSAVSGVIQSVMGIIQSVITIVLGVINGDWGAVWGGIQSLASSVWNAICSVVSGAIGIVSSVISGTLSVIQGVWSGAWDSLGSLLSSAWEGIKSGVSSGIDAVVGFLEGLPGQITGIFSGAGSWLVDSGKALLQGFADGVKGAVGWVGNQISGALSTIRGLFPFSPAKWGPFSGHGYTTYSGGAAMEGFGEGAVKAAGGVSDAIGQALAPVEASFHVADVAPLSVSTPSWAGSLRGTMAAATAAAAGDTYYVNATATGDQQIIDAVRLVVSRARRQAGAYA